MSIVVKAKMSSGGGMLAEYTVVVLKNIRVSRSWKSS